MRCVVVRLAIAACIAVSVMPVLAAVGIANGASRLPDLSGVACSEVAGQVNFQSLQVLHAAPTVGDEVEVRFDVEFLVYSVTQLRLEGASPLLEGDTVLQGARNPTFHLTAVEPGTAPLQLAVTYATEEQCVDFSGDTYFREGPEHTVTAAHVRLQRGSPGARSRRGVRSHRQRPRLPATAVTDII